jgi:hypothetical protein
MIIEQDKIHELYNQVLDGKFIDDENLLTLPITNSVKIIDELVRVLVDNNQLDKVLKLIDNKSIKFCNSDTLVYLIKKFEHNEEALHKLFKSYISSRVVEILVNQLNK